MNRTEYLNAVYEYMYQGEVLGEAVFACHVALETDASRRHKDSFCSVGTGVRLSFYRGTQTVRRNRF